MVNEEPDLFGEMEPSTPEPDGPHRPDGGDERPDADAPLAARMRPRTPEEMRGQSHLLAPDRPLGRMLRGGELSSCILWGPPGSGKTTLARLLATRADAAFVQFSAVTEGVARVREIIREARTRQQATGRRTILFCDEIHRFNRAQQDAFLPHVEDGTVVLVGATTENPSFEVNRPLLSRAPVFILNPLEEEELVEIMEEALADEERGLGGRQVRADDEALALLARGADGDARRALGALEVAVDLAEAKQEERISPELAGKALQHRFAIYDKSGEEHYNLISALHKAIRGSDPDGALYWLARMIRGGEDPLYVARRLVRMASEDVGMADPRALEAAVAAWRAYHFLGSPEGELALAQAAVYLATAPKSNRVYAAWKAAVEAAEETASAPVPLHIRNAPTREMREWGYGEGYRYDPDEPDGVARQEYLPDDLRGRTFYRPGRFGFEREVRRRLEWFARRRQGETETDADDGHPEPASG
ncbi:MAG: replication-associated recombination protein A [bacterium]